MTSGRAVRNLALCTLAVAGAAVCLGADPRAGRGGAPVPPKPPASGAPSAAPATLWVADPAVVRRVGGDGKNPTVVFAFDEAQSPLIASMAADPLHRRLFLAIEQGGATFDVNEIARVGMDGRGYLRLRSIAAGVRAAVAYDPREDRVYWLEGTSPTHVLRRMDASGASVTTLLTLSMEDVHDLEVDAEHGRLYWSQDENATHAGSIYGANLDGSGLKMLYTGLGTNVLEGIGLDVPRGKIYWVRSDGVLERGALDGSGKPEPVLQGAPVGRSASALGVQQASGDVFWISGADRSVRRLRRSGETSVVLETRRPRRLDVDNAVTPAPKR